MRVELASEPIITVTLDRKESETLGDILDEWMNLRSTLEFRADRDFARRLSDAIWGRIGDEGAQRHG